MQLFISSFRFLQLHLLWPNSLHIFHSPAQITAPRYWPWYWHWGYCWYCWFYSFWGYQSCGEYGGWYCDSWDCGALVLTELTALVMDILILLMRCLRLFILLSVTCTGGVVEGTVGTLVVFGKDIVTSTGSMKWAAFLIGAAGVVGGTGIADSASTECAVEYRSCLLCRRRSYISITFWITSSTSRACTFD